MTRLADIEFMSPSDQTNLNMQVAVRSTTYFDDDNDEAVPKTSNRSVRSALAFPLKNAQNLVNFSFLSGHFYPDCFNYQPRLPDE